MLTINDQFLFQDFPSVGVILFNLATLTCFVPENKTKQSVKDFIETCFYYVLLFFAVVLILYHILWFSIILNSYTKGANNITISELKGRSTI